MLIQTTLKLLVLISLENRVAHFFNFYTINVKNNHELFSISLDINNIAKLVTLITETSF